MVKKNKSETCSDSMDETLVDEGGIKLVRICSEGAAWILPLLVVAIVAQVFMRKVGFNQAWLDDAQWWMYGVAMMFGFAYASIKESHVRVDIFYENFTSIQKSKTEIFALGWLLLPFLIAMCDLTLHYALLSIKALEGSDSPNGLHHLYLLKTAVPLIFALTIVGVIAIFFQYLKRINKFNPPSIIIGALPSIWFLCERCLHYGLWWVYRLTEPGVRPSAISRMPVFDWIPWISAALIIVVFLICRARNREDKQA